MMKTTREEGLHLELMKVEFEISFPLLSSGDPILRGPSVIVILAIYGPYFRLPANV